MRNPDLPPLLPPLPPGTVMTDGGVLVRLADALAVSGSQAAFAERAGVSPQYLNDIVHCRRRAPRCVLSEIGLAEDDRRYVAVAVVGAGEPR